ncbi:MULTISPECIES: DUF1236 domain-containing protein [Bradyrhizobium]|uniref:DUF1236 domain-containing protein n=1 Tax=Bradyrhizobium TaxID=374 RepID=UPI001BAD4475|nr:MULTISPECIES: DUF1236 domain-containing protein [Bradyrhizobium]MBR0705806.1 DUF1236 domain-containing protein [Bradyrhizobium liaoningense]MDA9401880.1 hypothetical protein [Bradyrhizobium sp. CCBAU 45389]
MLNRFMISVAALALVAGTGLANAQDKGRDSGGAGSQQQMQHSQPSGGAAERGSMGRDSAHEKGTVGQAGGAGSMKSDRAADDKSSGAMKDEHRGREMNKNAAEDKAGATKGQRTDERAQGQMDKSQQDKSKSMSQDTTKSGQKDKDMKAEGSKSGTSTNNAETQKGTGTSTNQNAQGQTGTNTTVGQAGAGAKLSTEQRTQITSVIREQRVAPVTNVNFAISVGTRIPREGIELHALPSRVATIYPEWRSYRYVMVREQIVIIDPNTYEIIAVLDV